MDAGLRKNGSDVRMQFVQHKEKRCLGFIDAVTDLLRLEHGVDEVCNGSDLAVRQNDINGFRCAGSAKRHTVAKVNACMKKGFCTGFDLSEQFGKGDLHAEVFQRKVMGMCLIVLINVLIYSTFSRFCMDRFRAVIF